MNAPPHYDDPWMRLLLLEVKSIAVVGLSHDEAKPSYHVSSYMKRNGYRIFPVNPRPGIILGEATYSDLGSVPARVDLVNVFRPSETCLEIVRDAVKLRPKVIWLQLGMSSQEAARWANEAGVPIIMDRCIQVEHRRLLGEKLVHPSVL